MVWDNEAEPMVVSAEQGSAEGSGEKEGIRDGRNTSAGILPTIDGAGRNGGQNPGVLGRVWMGELRGVNLPN
ncbi:hypothetical protein E2562_037269 [Oryza meyeriana var. granulata]|uniref:Uncharacterized protein n=1 Tax=Oryza meyeriana var. granulata TaxID=110450 RepID=A0A6G1EBJ6_9ORYZ|nr:hypothetical protein E2562_037269 [Oryza meyeriana var. granulata]